MMGVTHTHTHTHTQTIQTVLLLLVYICACVLYGCVRACLCLSFSPSPFSIPYVSLCVCGIFSPPPVRVSVGPGMIPTTSTLEERHTYNNKTFLQADNSDCAFAFSPVTVPSTCVLFNLSPPPPCNGTSITFYFPESESERTRLVETACVGREEGDLYLQSRATTTIYTFYPSGTRAASTPSLSLSLSLSLSHSSLPTPPSPTHAHTHTHTEGERERQRERERETCAYCISSFAFFSFVRQR